MAVPDSEGQLLVIEEDSPKRESLARVLSEAGYRVVAAPDGREAMRMLRKGVLPDLILLDMTLRQSGIEFCRILLSEPQLASVPVLALSGTTADAQRGPYFNVERWLDKPVDLNLLLQIVGGLSHPSAEAAATV